MAEGPAGGGRPRLELMTVTRLWLFRRRLYNLGNVKLSLTGPIAYRTIGYAAVFYVPVFIVAGLLGVGWVGLEVVARLAVPGLLTWWALKHAGEGAKTWEFAWSWVAFGVALAAGWLAGPGVRPVRVASKVRVL